MVTVTTFLASAVACVSLIQGVVAQEPFVITGVPSGGVQPRYEIRDLQNNHYPMWNLFLQSLEKMQAERQGNEASYYQIAGIHGAPFISWDEVGRTGNGNGYCPHSSNLFGPWHRPYLALWEQRIAFWARRIAENFPAGQKRDTYRAAAQNIRMPYWDWAKSGNRVMPESVVSPNIQVERPNGRKVSIRNPLSRYVFHPLDPNALVFGPMNQWPETKRAPSGGGSNPSSNNAQVEAGFKQQRPNLRQSIYNILASGGEYNRISNWGIGTTSNNFEAVHNNIHSGFGSNSHMSLPPLAAFDPIFWLHHANVDRLLAIWQYLYPSTYVNPTEQFGGTWTINEGSTQDANSPLTPFHNSATRSFWTSNSARNVQNLGYTYPEIQGNPSQATVRTRVNQLYGSAVGVSGKVAKKLKTKRAVPDPLTTVPEVNIELDIAAGETVYQYTAEILMPKALNNQPYNVLLFLGEPSDDASQWLTDPNMVGFQASLGNVMNGDPNVIKPANVFLTDAVVAKFEAGELDGLDQDTVTAYLTDNLHWRAEQFGTAIPPDEIPAVEVHLVSQTVEAPEGADGFPNYLESNPVAPINSTMAPGA